METVKNSFCKCKSLVGMKICVALVFWMFCYTKGRFRLTFGDVARIVCR